MAEDVRLTIRQAIDRTKGAATSVAVKELGFREPQYYDTIDDGEGAFDVYFDVDGYDLFVGVYDSGETFAFVRKGDGPAKHFDGKSVLYCIPVR